MPRPASLPAFASACLVAGFAAAADAPEAARPGEIVGRVVDADGNPIEGAVVDAWTWTRGTETTTDADGRFTLDPHRGDDDGDAEIRVSAPGFSPHYDPRQAVGGPPITVTLDAETFLEGRVTTADGGPAAGAVVKAVTGPFSRDGSEISEVATETTTDSDGRY